MGYCHESNGSNVEVVGVVSKKMLTDYGTGAER